MSPSQYVFKIYFCKHSSKYRVTYTKFSEALATYTQFYRNRGNDGITCHIPDLFFELFSYMNLYKIRIFIYKLNWGNCHLYWHIILWGRWKNDHRYRTLDAYGGLESHVTGSRRFLQTGSYCLKTLHFYLSETIVSPSFASRVILTIITQSGISRKPLSLGKSNIRNYSLC